MFSNVSITPTPDIALVSQYVIPYLSANSYPSSDVITRFGKFAAEFLQVAVDYFTSPF